MGDDMTATNILNRKIVRNIKADIDKALSQIAYQYNLETLRTTTASYTSESFTVKIEGVVEGGKSKQGAAYEAWASSLDLPPLGTTFTYGASDYKIVGLNRTKTKVLATDLLNGKRYAFWVQSIRSIFGKSGENTQSRSGRPVRGASRSNRRTAVPSATAEGIDQPSSRMGFPLPEEKKPGKGRFAIDL